MKFINSLVAFSLVAIVFAIGVASRGLLGDWVGELIKLSFVDQFKSVFRFTFGVLTATVAVGINLLIFIFVVFFVVAFVQEFHYQFFKRKLLNILLKKVKSGEKEKVRQESIREHLEREEVLRRRAEYEKAKEYSKAKAKKGRVESDEES